MIRITRTPRLDGPPFRPATAIPAGAPAHAARDRSAFVGNLGAAALALVVVLSGSTVARAQLDDVRHKIARLRALETELGRIVDGCSGKGAPQDCYVLASLSDHDMCKTEHGADH